MVETIKVSVNDIARFGAATAVVHALLANNSTMPVEEMRLELAMDYGIYGKVLDMALRKLETAQYIAYENSDGCEWVSALVGIE
jgi:hypothetical protein